MAITFIKRSMIPVSVKGKAASAPTVSISDKGQMSFNSLATAFLNEPFVAFGYDAGKLMVFRKGSAVLVKAKATDADLIELRKGKKSGTGFSFAASNLLKSHTKYDYAKSGNQIFNAALDEKNGSLVIEIPEGSLTPKPKADRKPRKKKVASVVKAEVGSTEAVAPEDELSLEVA